MIKIRREYDIKYESLDVPVFLLEEEDVISLDLKFFSLPGLIIRSEGKLYWRNGDIDVAVSEIKDGDFLYLGKRIKYDRIRDDEVPEEAGDDPSRAS